MKEIRIHARAGQGAITTAMLLASAAFEENIYGLAFPHFGAERMGAPLNAYVRLDKAPINIRTQVREPDYILVQDSTLLRGFDVTTGLRPNGLVIINDERTPDELGLRKGIRVLAFPASRLAIEYLGRADRASTAMLGAFSGATGEIKLESLKKAVLKRFPGVVGEKNVQVLDKAYEIARSSPVCVVAK
ncbi:MAG: 2-oxoacid:acceptor oxidoreductase family protein [Dehalococcoidia bacterium]|nr:2-oxoacid:acceptor oxidoreductase family protein [Dehalococcoidia bacterium]